MTASKDDLRTCLINALGDNVEDADEGKATRYGRVGPSLTCSLLEIFSLFSQLIPSQNLGFVDSAATSVHVDVAGHEYELIQSPGLLNAARKGGTTGAVLWKVSPAVARWLLSKKNVLWVAGVLHQQANVVELGCGIAGIIGICLHCVVGTYILTDQEYVLKRLQVNIDANITIASREASHQRGRLKVAALDWEADSASNLRIPVGKDAFIDLVIACDCIYNDFLIRPFVETCVEVCKLSEGGRSLLLVAQQLRSDDVLSQWLRTSMQYFDVWRLPDEQLSSELASGSGFVVHLLLLRNDC